MSENIKVNLETSHRLKKMGVFNFNKLYEEMKEWIKNNNYDFTEKGFVDKNQDTGKEIVVDWIGNREINDLFKYNIQIKFFIRKGIPTGKDLLKGIIDVSFKADLEVDYKNKWKHNASSNFFFKIYTKYTIKKDINNHLERLYAEMVELHDMAKEILEFYK